MSLNNNQQVIASFTEKLCKEDLLILFVSALRTESYRYASILRDEIRNRQFSAAEIVAVKNSSFYPQLNNIFG